MDRVTHNNVILYAGPAPATGYHWLNKTTLVKQNVTGASQINDVYNLIHPIYRVQSTQYDINATRPNVTALGSKSIIVDEITDYNINFTCDYLQHGVINELRLGFYANYHESGSAVYGYFDKPALSGFYNRSFLNTRGSHVISNTAQSGIPHDYRDCRNLFMLVSKDGDDSLGEDYSTLTSHTSNIEIYGIGNAYITSYSASASVGDFPRASVSFTADNIEQYNNLNYPVIPAIDPSTGSNPSLNFNLPTYTEGQSAFETIATVVRPKDITLKIAEVNESATKKAINATGTTTSDYATAIAAANTSLNIQGYDLSVGIEREALNAVGYKRPLDRTPKAPTLIDLTINVLDNQNSFNYLQEKVDENKDYYVSIQLANATGDWIDVQYDFLRMKCIGVNQSHNVQQNSITSYIFQGDSAIDDYTKGFFISGAKNIYKRDIEY